VALERLGSNPVEQPDEILRRAKHGGADGVAPERARLGQPQRRVRRFDPKRDPGGACLREDVVRPRPPSAVRSRRRRVTQREGDVLLGQLDRGHVAGVGREDVALRRGRLGSVSDHQPPCGVVSRVSGPAEQAGFAGGDQGLAPDVPRPVGGKEAHAHLAAPARDEREDVRPRVSGVERKPDGVLPWSRPGDDPDRPVCKGLERCARGHGRGVERKRPHWHAPSLFKRRSRGTVADAVNTLVVRCNRRGAVDERLESRARALDAEERLRRPAIDPSDRGIPLGF
jgi:hypothetical protein